MSFRLMLVRLSYSSSWFLFSNLFDRETQSDLFVSCVPLRMCIHGKKEKKNKRDSKLSKVRHYGSRTHTGVNTQVGHRSM